MNIFEITIQHWQEEKSGWPVVTEYTQPGQLPRRSEGLLTLPEDYEVQLRMLQLDAQGYGTLLGEALFHGTIRDRFITARAEAVKTPLRVLLVVEPSDLETLRWERLCAPSRHTGWDFLAMDQNTPFSLYLPSLTDQVFSTISSRNLRALVVLADPPKENRHKLAAFGAQETANRIGKALGGISYDLLGQVEGAEGLATADALYKQLTKQQYTLLHLVAHGWYKKGEENETVLYLLNDKGDVAPLTASKLINRLQRQRGIQLPHLAFLCTCESAEAEAATALGGLAQRLVRELGLPAVVAMTDPVSIATADELAPAFYRQLREHGQPDLALTESGVDMQDRPDILVPALYSRLGGRPLFSDKLGKRPLNDPEIEYGLERLACLLPERAPVLVDRFLDLFHIVEDTIGIDPNAPSSAASKEYDQALGKINNLCDKVLDRSFPAVALGQKVESYISTCPFPGLKAFQTDEQKFFFGRDKKTEELIARLQDKDKKFLAVLGASGSGKSSLVLAGMIPALKKQAEKKGSSLQIRYLTPGSEPETALTRQLEIPSQPGQTVLLLVDQFEELFTLCADPAARKAFLDKLLNTRNEQPDLSIILTMRADFWGDCAPYPELNKLMQAHQELLAPMTTAELRTAMEQQASSVKLRFEGGLSHTILSAVKDEPGAMPLLQHLLLELWKRRYGRWLMTSEYKKLGGIKKAIGRTADAFYDELRSDKEGQGLLRNLFVRLTRLDKTAENVEQQRDTRQRVNLQELLSLNPDPEQVRILVNRLADARLLVKDTDAETEETNVEVAHEALIRHWKRLRTWVNEDRESWMLLASVRQQAQDWEKGGKKAGDLPRWGERLRDAKLLFGKKRFAQSELEREFLQVCKELSDKEKAKEAAYLAGLKKRLVISVVGIAAAVTLAAVAGMLWRKAEQNAAVAEQKTAEATTERDRAKQQTLAANYNLAKAFEKESLRSVEKAAKEGISAYQQALLFVSAALKQQIETNKVPLTPESIGTLFTPEVFNAALAERWVSSYQQSDSMHLAFSSDGKRLASVIDDNTVRIWDIYTGNEIKILQGDNNGINSISFSHDGKRLASGSDDGTVMIWDVESDRKLTTFKGHDENIDCVAFSPDSKILASASRDNTIRLWNIENDSELIIFEGHTKPVRSVSFSPDSKRLVSGSDDGTVRIWDIESKQQISVLEGHTEPVCSVSFSLDGNIMRSVSRFSGTIRSWNIRSKQQISMLEGRAEILHSASFSPDSKQLASVSRKGIVQIRNIESGKKLTVLKGDINSITSVSFNSDGKMLAIAGKGTIRLLDIKNGGTSTIFKGHTGPVRSVAFNPDGTWLASGSTDNTARLWNIKSGKEQNVFMGHASYVNSVAFSPNGTSLASSSKDTTIRLWDIKSGNESGIFKEHSAPVNSVSFSSDGTRLASASGSIFSSRDNTVRLWDTVNGKEQAIFKGHTSYVKSVAFSPDGALLASGSGDKTVRLWDIANRKKLAIFKGHTSYVRSVAFSPDGALLASGSVDGTVRLWDIANRKGINILRGHTRLVISICFSLDGKWLASASGDETVRLWNIENGQELLTLKGHSSYVNSVSFSPDGRRLASASNDKTVRLWDLRLYILFFQDSNPTPFYRTFIEAVKFLWQLDVQGLEIVKTERRTPADLEKYGALLAPPPPGKSKFDQVLEWAKKQPKEEKPSP